MRHLFTTREALAMGLTPSRLRWGESSGRWRTVIRGVYGEGPEPPTALDRARALAVVTDGVASGRLALRPPGAPPTESLLETLMVQLVRRLPDLDPPVRQLEVRSAGGVLIARVDLAWPDLGLFLELDGQHHRGQPLYDASRETAVVATTGWLCGRFTWTDVVRVPTSTTRRLAQLVDQARRRPIASPVGG